MCERIKKLRKTLDLTQQEFASRIGIKRNTIANYETGRNEPVDTVISLICREFSVNQEWLRTGEGEMFVPKANNALETLIRERGLSRGVYIVIEKFLNLKPKLQEGIIDYFLEVSAALSSDGILTPSPVSSGITEEVLHAKRSQ